MRFFSAGNPRRALAMGLGVVGLVTCVSPYEPQAEFREALPKRDAGVGGASPENSGGGGASPGSGGGGAFVGTGGEATGGASGTGGTFETGGSVATGGFAATGGFTATGGAVGSAGSQGMGGAPTPGSLCTFTVTMTTVSTGGRYGPRNVGAIWITDATGAFVKTLELWGKQRVDALTPWYDATYLAGSEGNTVDAITGATLSSHKSHQASWNCTDLHEKVVPLAPYTLHMEVTENSLQGATATFDFTTSDAPFTLAPPDQPNFVGIKVVFTP